MDKKAYYKPEIEEVSLEQQSQLLAGSISDVNSNADILLGEADGGDGRAAEFDWIDWGF